MFPLSTPTHSGLAIDLASIAIVLAGLTAFAVGLADLWARARLLRARGPDLDAITLAVYGALTLVGLTVVIMLAGGRGIPVAQGFFLAIAGWGVAIAVRRAPRARRWVQQAPGAELAKAALFTAAACWSIWFWADVFRDHVALPVAHDGIAHAAWYLRILEAGVPTLGRVPIGFRDVFGTQMIEFYPTGTHALIAITSGFWGQWGVVSHAGILKAWFTLGVAGTPWALLWMARRLMPRMPWWLGLAVVFFALPGFRFPTEAAHEGGASRIFAHVLLTPIYADVVLGRFKRWRGFAVAGVFLGLSFLMHPTAFVTLSALLAYAAIYAAMVDSRAWRSRVATLAGPVLAAAIGGGIATALLHWNRAQVLPRSVAVGAFSLTGLWTRLSLGWKTLFDVDYGMAPLEQVVVVAGLVLLFLQRRRLGVSRRAVGFVACLVVVAVIALAAAVVPLPVFAQVGGAYYDEAPRTVEVVYEAVGFCLIALGWAAWRFVRGPAGDSGARTWRAAASTVLAATIVVAAIGHQKASTGWVHRHIGFWDAHFATPRISRLRALGAWIEQYAERDAIVFHEPFDSEIWEAWTGRRGSFMYGECFAHNGQSPCVARRELVTGRVGVLRKMLDDPAPAARCLASIDRFGRPGYFLVVTPIASTTAFPVCSDAVYLTSLDGRAIFSYRRPFLGAALVKRP
jgi:hypothetical protein